MKKKIFAALMGIIVLLNTVFLNYVAAAVVETGSIANAVGDDNESANTLVPSITVEKIMTDGTKMALSPNSSSDISLDDVISVTYKFASPITVVGNNTPDLNGTLTKNEIIVHTGEKYLLPSVPDVLTQNDTENIEVKISGIDKPFGTIEFENGKTYLNVTYDPGEGNTVDIVNAIAGFQLKFSQSDFSEADTKSGLYELKFGDNYVFKVKINEYKLNEPNVTKNGTREYDENGNPTGYIDWEVVVTNDAKPVLYNNYSFIDSLDKNQIYKEGSLQMYKEASDTWEDVTLSDSSKLEWEYTGADIEEANKTFKYRYKTYVDTLGMASKTNENMTEEKNDIVKNSLTVKATSKNSDYEDLNLGPIEATVNIPTLLSKWVEKTGSTIDSDGNTTWTVDIKNNGFTLNNLRLVDTITPDSLKNAKPVNIDLDLNTVSVKEIDSNGNDTGAVIDFTPSYSNNVLTVNFNETMSGNKTYRVSYTTKILNYQEKYLNENHGMPTNSAKIYYDYDKNGISASAGSPSVSKPFFTDTVTTYKSAIEKKALDLTSDDYKNHQMRWMVTVNKNKQQLVDATIKDVLPRGLEFVSISDITIDASETSFVPEISFDTENGKNDPIFNFSNELNGHVATFIITTKLDDTQSKVWAGNMSASYTNKVILSSTGNEDVSDEVIKTYAGNVLTKKASTYNYKTHEITYTLTVNSKNVTLNDVNISDKLDSRLEYVSGSALVGSEGIEPVITSDNGSDLLEFKLGNIDSSKVITFKAKLKDDKYLANDVNIDIFNKAVLTREKFSDDDLNERVTSNEVKTNITNKMITKQGKQSDKKTDVDFTVYINPNSQDIYDGMNENQIILARDTMGTSFTLLKDSIKLYKAESSEDGKSLIPYGESIITEADINTSLNDAGKTILTVNIPNVGKSAYVLTYTARMLDASQTDISNDVELVGSTVSNTATAKWDTSVADFSNAGLDSFTYLTVKLVDEMDNTKPLSGATFKLIDSNGKVIDEKVTDSNGIIVFNGLGELEPSTEYTIVESKIPEGYELPMGSGLDSGIKITTPSAPGLGTAKKELAKNTYENTKPKVSATVKINDISKQGRYLKDANFKLEYSKNPTATKNLVKEWTSNGEVNALDLTEGVYYLTRTKQPAGFVEESKSISFRIVNEDGNAKLVFDDAIGEINSDTSLMTIDVIETADEDMGLTLDNLQVTKNGIEDNSIHTVIVPVNYKDGLALAGIDPIWDSEINTDAPVLLPEVEYEIILRDELGNSKSIVVMVDIFELAGDEGEVIFKTNLLKKDSITDSEYSVVELAADEDGAAININIETAKIPTKPSNTGKENSVSLDDDLLVIVDNSFYGARDIEINNDEVLADEISMKTVDTGDLTASAVIYLAIILIVSGVIVVALVKKEEN